MCSLLAKIMEYLDQRNQLLHPILEFFDIIYSSKLFEQSCMFRLVISIGLQVAHSRLHSKITSDFFSLRDPRGDARSCESFTKIQQFDDRCTIRRLSRSKVYPFQTRAFGDRVPGSRRKVSLPCLSESERSRRSRTKLIIHIRV